MASIEAYTGRKEIGSLCVGWTISKFKDKMDMAKPGECILLQNLKVGETKWTFKVYANGDIEEHKGFVSVFCQSENENSTYAEVSIAVKEYKLTFPCKFSEFHYYWGYKTFLAHSAITEKEYLKNGHLQMVLKIIVYGDEETTKTEVLNFDSIKMLEKNKLGEDFKECWMDDKFSDVTIKCGGVIFHCHRTFLARRSNYFRTMLESSFKESHSGQIVMENMDADTFRAILKYIYEGELESLETNAMYLLEASERFEMTNVKNICEDFIIANYMKLENVIDTLLMADLYKAKTLKQAAMDMIIANSDEVVNQDGWKEKLGRSGHLIYEIFDTIAVKK